MKLLAASGRLNVVEYTMNDKNTKSHTKFIFTKMLVVSFRRFVSLLYVSYIHRKDITPGRSWKAFVSFI